MRKETSDLWKLAEPYIAGAGFELVELQWNREAEGWVMRIFIDRPFQDGVQGAPRLPEGRNGDSLFERPLISHEDCAVVSRDVSAALDVANVVPHAYRLEVSSPGIDRPLRREQDFQRFAGQKVKLRTTDAVEGRRNFSGTIHAAHEGLVEVDCDGQSYKVPLDIVVRANLVPDWTAEFKRAGDSRDLPVEPRRARDPQIGSDRSAS